MENRAKVETEKTNEPKGKEKEESSNGKSLFSAIERKMKLETYFEEGFPVQHLPKILFVLGLSLFYIGNTHYAEKTTRAINKAQSEVEDLRADFITIKADMMFSAKQSEVARRVKVLGLKESLSPPYKVTVTP
jgi:Bacteriodetes cell division protein (FtsL-like)